MKFGISTYAFSWAIGVPGYKPEKPLNHYDLLRKAKELDIGLIQVADNLALHDLPDHLIELFIKQADELQVQLEAGARGMTEKNLDKYIRITERIKSPILRFVVDGPGFMPAREEIIGIINNACKDLESRSIILALENYERLSVKDFARIIEKVGSDNVGICLDTVNSIGAGEGIETTVATLGPMTVNLHIKEFIVRRLEHNLGFMVEGAPAGEGMLNISWLLQHIGPRCRSAILEQWTPWEKDIQSTINKENVWAAKSVGYLKRFFS